MTTRQKQACPLCAESATYALFDYGHRKALECASCGQYVITTIAESLLSSPPGTREQRLAAYVRQVDDPSKIAEIRTENGPDGGKQLSAQVLSRDSLRLP